MDRPRSRQRPRADQGRDAATCSPFGIVHGGVYATLAESICSAATYDAVTQDGMVAMGQSNDTTFLRPISEGTHHRERRTRHRGRTTWVWDVEMSDDEGRRLRPLADDDRGAAAAERTDA